MVFLARGVELHFGVVLAASLAYSRAASECPDWLGLGFPSGPGKMVGALAKSYPGEKVELKLYAKHPEAIVGAEDEARSSGSCVMQPASRLTAIRACTSPSICPRKWRRMRCTSSSLEGGESLTYHGISRGT